MYFRKLKTVLPVHFFREPHELVAQSLPDQQVDILFINDLVTDPDRQPNMRRLTEEEAASLKGTGNNPNAVRDPAHPNANVEIRGDHISDSLVEVFKVWWPKMKYGAIMAGSGILEKQIVEAVSDFRTANEVHVAGSPHAGGVYWWYVEPPEE